MKSSAVASRTRGSKWSSTPALDPRLRRVSVVDVEQPRPTISCASQVALYSRPELPHLLRRREAPHVSCVGLSEERAEVIGSFCRIRAFEPRLELRDGAVQPPQEVGFFVGLQQLWRGRGQHASTVAFIRGVVAGSSRRVACSELPADASQRAVAAPRRAPSRSSERRRRSLGQEHVKCSRGSSRGSEIVEASAIASVSMVSCPAAALGADAVPLRVVGQVARSLLWKYLESKPHGAVEPASIQCRELASAWRSAAECDVADTDVRLLGRLVRHDAGGLARLCPE